MTIKQLRDALDKLGTGHDNKSLVVWLPGSHIDLQYSFILRNGEVLVEGNVRPGSALEQ